MCIRDSYAANPDKTGFTEDELKDVIDYAKNFDKTDGEKFVTGINCCLLYTSKDRSVSRHERASEVWKDNLFHYTHDLMTS